MLKFDNKDKNRRILHFCVYNLIESYKRIYPNINFIIIDKINKILMNFL